MLVVIGALRGFTGAAPSLTPLPLNAVNAEAGASTCYYEYEVGLLLIKVGRPASPAAFSTVTNSMIAINSFCRYAYLDFERRL